MWSFCHPGGNGMQQASSDAEGAFGGRTESSAPTRGAVGIGSFGKWEASGASFAIHNIFIFKEDKQMNKIKVERETYNKNDKEYFAYFIKGNVRGRDVKLSVVPQDVGGYTVLDIVFNGAMEAELVITPFEMKTDNGQIIKGNTFSVRSIDEDGTVYECSVKPSRRSDKELLAMLIR